MHPEKKLISLNILVHLISSSKIEWIIKINCTQSSKFLCWPCTSEQIKILHPLPSTNQLVHPIYWCFNHYHTFIFCSPKITSMTLLFISTCIMCTGEMIHYFSVYFHIYFFCYSFDCSPSCDIVGQEHVVAFKCHFALCFYYN